MLYPAFIGLLVRFGARQHVASYSPASHRAKEGTPTLGGALFCFVVVVAWLAVDRSQQGFVVIFALLAGAIAGGLDDVVNINDASRLGLSVWQKLGLQGVTGVLVGIGLTTAGFTHQFFPGLGAPNLGWGLAVVAAIAVVATSNAVNLTDGVDGLAASCTSLVLVGIAIIAVTRHDTSAAIIAAALAGAVVAFLIFNWFPARVFMGDAGSLALGSAIVALTAELHLHLVAARSSASCSSSRRQASWSTSPRSAGSGLACYGPARSTTTSRSSGSASSGWSPPSPRLPQPAPPSRCSSTTSPARSRERQTGRGDRSGSQRARMRRHARS